MASVKFPLSGDVSQLIAPWGWFIRQAGQLGLININIGASPAPEVESQILDQVGSYGRQIGRLADAVEVLVACLDRNSLTSDQQAAVTAFEQQLQEVRVIKQAGNLGPQPSLKTKVPGLMPAALARSA